jgi:lambda repressor-like predicted transcriptional regulator
MATDTTPAMRAATARWMRRRRRLIAYGQWQPFVDAEPVRQHVQAIRETGMAITTLSEKTGVTIATLDHLVYGRDPYPPARKIRTESATALLAYWPTLDDYPDLGVVDSTGTARRVQALAAIGWTAAAIHRQLGFGNVASIERVHTHPGVKARLARAIRDLYAWASIGQAEDHGVTAWVARRQRNRAAQLGFLAPAWWDDDTIDDPAAGPCLPEDVPRYVALAENCAELERLGHSRQQIAERLGVTRDGLQRALSLYRQKTAADATAA